ncbi:unnamed protein product [Schistosoma guineensis]|nr:unnamed protein product [Schistosoma guineensis]
MRAQKYNLLILHIGFDLLRADRGISPSRSFVSQRSSESYECSVALLKDQPPKWSQTAFGLMHKVLVTN